jgi:hypothetical protein
MMIQEFLTGTLVASALLVSACTVSAATVTATPDNVKDVILAAQAGDTVRLAAGSYQPISIKNKGWSQPVVVDASAARLQSVEMASVNNLIWRGGIFDGTTSQRWGVMARASQNVGVEQAQFSHYLRAGIVFDHVSGGRIARNLFSDMGSDGADIALSDHIVVDGNECRDFTPTDGAHPDCIQAWSRPTAPPTSDLTITNNRMTGMMQGISLFNHKRGGVDDGGFDRIVITGNVVRVGFPNGISTFDCRACTIRDNVVDGMPGGSVRATLRTDRSNVMACKNGVAILAAASARCRGGAAGDAVHRP